MSNELVIAFIYFGSALIGLTAALIGRKKVVEIRYVSAEQPTIQQKEQPNTLPKKLRWYDKTFWLVFWIILFWPLGLYGILRSRAVSRKWKIFVVVCFVILMIASQNKT